MLGCGPVEGPDMSDELEFDESEFIDSILTTALGGVNIARSRGVVESMLQTRRLFAPKKFERSIISILGFATQGFCAYQRDVLRVGQRARHRSG